MRGAQGALDGAAGRGHKGVSIRRLGVVDEDLVEDQVFGVDEVLLKVRFQRGIHMGDELGIGGVLLGECGFVFA